MVDAELIGEIHDLISTGKAATYDGKRVMSKLEKRLESHYRELIYANIPQRDWRRMSKRQTKVLHDQQDKYGLPIGGPTINLNKLAPALHDFLAANATRLVSSSEDGLLIGGSSPALERYREERAAMARIERMKMEGQLVSVTSLQDPLTKISELLRAAGERLQRMFGQSAQDVIDQALDAAMAEIERVLSPPGDDDSHEAALVDDP